MTTSGDLQGFEYVFRADKSIDVSNKYADGAWTSLSEVVVGRRRQLSDQSVSAKSSSEPSTTISGLIAVTPDSGITVECFLTRCELYIDSNCV